MRTLSKCSENLASLYNNEKTYVTNMDRVLPPLNSSDIFNPDEFIFRVDESGHTHFFDYVTGEWFLNQGGTEFPSFLTYSQLYAEIFNNNISLILNDPVIIYHPLGTMLCYSDYPLIDILLNSYI